MYTIYAPVMFCLSLSAIKQYRGVFHETCHHWQFVIHWLLPWQQSVTVLQSQSKSRMSLYSSVNDKLSVMTSFMKCPPGLRLVVGTFFSSFFLLFAPRLSKKFCTSLHHDLQSSHELSRELVAWVPGLLPGVGPPQPLFHQQSVLDVHV